MYFVTFVLTAQFVLVNVVVAVLMKHLEDSNKEAQLEEMEEREERREREERKEREEREEANRRLSTTSVGGDLGQNVDTPAQVTDGVCVHISACVRGKGVEVTITVTAVMISCGRCRLRMRSVPMATC